jgi:hypothetical protein
MTPLEIGWLVIIAFLVIGGAFGFGTIYHDMRKDLDGPWVGEDHPARTTPWKKDTP